MDHQQNHVGIFFHRVPPSLSSFFSHNLQTLTDENQSVAPPFVQAGPLPKPRCPLLLVVWGTHAAQAVDWADTSSNISQRTVWSCSLSLSFPPDLPKT